jgi:hypothetical protein
LSAPRPYRSIEAESAEEEANRTSIRATRFLEADAIGLDPKGQIKLPFSVNTVVKKK